MQVTVKSCMHTVTQLWRQWRQSPHIFFHPLPNLPLTAICFCRSQFFPSFLDKKMYKYFFSSLWRVILTKQSFAWLYVYTYFWLNYKFLFEIINISKKKKKSTSTLSFVLGHLIRVFFHNSIQYLSSWPPRDLFPSFSIVIFSHRNLSIHRNLFPSFTLQSCHVACYHVSVCAPSISVACSWWFSVNFVFPRLYPTLPHLSIYLSIWF